jgi:hypothetical protein
LTRHDRRIARLELESSGVWYAETTSGVGAYRWDKEAAVQAALENERQALMMDVMEDRGKRQLQSPSLTQEELMSLLACGLVRQLVRCGERAVYELTPEGRVLLGHSIRLDEVG